MAKLTSTRKKKSLEGTQWESLHDFFNNVWEYAHKTSAPDNYNDAGREFFAAADKWRDEQQTIRLKT